jgi:hypothetical protein
MSINEELLERIAITSNRHMLHASEMSVLITATWCNIPEDGILHSHCCDNLNSNNEALKICTRSVTLTITGLNPESNQAQIKNFTSLYQF